MWRTCIAKQHWWIQQPHTYNGTIGDESGISTEDLRKWTSYNNSALDCYTRQVFLGHCQCESTALHYSACFALSYTQPNKLNLPSVSSEIFTEHVNSTVELIRANTFCGKGPLMTDSAEQQQSRLRLTRQLHSRTESHGTPRKSSSALALILGWG